jgi:hypothetical protein
MLRKKYLNKKYLFSKNGPLDEETQNIVSQAQIVLFEPKLYQIIEHFKRYWKKLVVGK